MPGDSSREPCWVFRDGVEGEYGVAQIPPPGTCFQKSMFPFTMRGPVCEQNPVSSFLRELNSRLSESQHSTVFKKGPLNVKLEDFGLSSVILGKLFNLWTCFLTYKNENTKYVPYLAGFVAVWLKWCSQFVSCNVLHEFWSFGCMLGFPATWCLWYPMISPRVRDTALPALFISTPVSSLVHFHKGIHGDTDNFLHYISF